VLSSKESTICLLIFQFLLICIIAKSNCADNLHCIYFFSGCYLFHRQILLFSPKWLSVSYKAGPFSRKINKNFIFVSKTSKAVFVEGIHKAYFLLASYFFCFLPYWGYFITSSMEPLMISNISIEMWWALLCSNGCPAVQHQTFMDTHLMQNFTTNIYKLWSSFLRKTV
jgi:hypothetical protein